MRGCRIMQAGAVPLLTALGNPTSCALAILSYPLCTGNTLLPLAAQAGRAAHSLLPPPSPHPLPKPSLLSPPPPSTLPPLPTPSLNRPPFPPHSLVSASSRAMQRWLAG